MMTEEQAREKWCPFVRVGFGMNAPDQSCIAATGNRMTTMDDECNCIASDCMAWRWAHLGGDHNAIGEPLPENVPGEGYCGLSGTPR